MKISPASSADIRAVATPRSAAAAQASAPATDASAAADRSLTPPTSFKRIDTFERTSPIGAETAPAKTQDAERDATLGAPPPQIPPTPAQTQPAPFAPASEPQTDSAEADRTFNSKDRDTLLGLWGARSSDSRFDAQYDLNADGVINSTDLASLLGRFRPDEPYSPPPSGPAPSQPSAGPRLSPDLKSLLGSFGRREGDEGFNAAYDYDGDGRITSYDLAQHLGRSASSGSSEPPRTDPPTTPSSTSDPVLDAIRAAWGARAGEAKFDAELDLDGDGAINARDLAFHLGAARNSGSGGAPSGGDSAGGASAAGASSAPESIAESVKALLAAFGRRTGDQGFETRFDEDSDGAITSRDLAQLLGRLARGAAPANEGAPTRQFTQADIESLRAAWGARSGDQRFVADYDFDADGAITSRDLANLLGRLR